jgi:DNA repair protein RadA/Sms
MAKTKAKTKYVCQNCGYVSASWLGKCPECGTWNSLVEEVETQTKEKGFVSFIENSKPRTIRSVSARPVERLVTDIGEFDRVLGGGIVPGSLVLLSGDPGIGKSTILLDTAMRFSQKGVKILYVSGEESEEQTAMRAKRLGHCTDSLLIMTASEIGGILLQAEHENRICSSLIPSRRCTAVKSKRLPAVSARCVSAQHGCSNTPRRPAPLCWSSATSRRTAPLPARGFWSIW